MRWGWKADGRGGPPLHSASGSPVVVYQGCGRLVNSRPFVAPGPAPPVQIITPSLIMSMTLFSLHELRNAMPAALVELFPARERYTGLSIGYNLSLALFGGTAPLVATFLIRETGNIMAPSFYVIITAVFTAALLFRHPETFRITLK